VVLFYLSQPGRLVKLADQGMRGMAGYGTEHYMASYPSTAGTPPYAQEHRLNVVFWLSWLYRSWPWLYALQWVLVAGVSITVLRWNRTALRRRSVGVLALFLLGGASLQFWAVMMSDGKNEIFKHMVSVDQMMFLSLVVVFVAWRQRRLTVVGVDPLGSESMAARRNTTEMDTERRGKV
jgi:hypothetical protein